MWLPAILIPHLFQLDYNSCYNKTYFLYRQPHRQIYDLDYRFLLVLHQIPPHTMVMGYISGSLY